MEYPWNLVSLAGTLLTVTVAWLVYRRTKTLDNENHLFRVKLEAYQTIVEKIAGTLDQLTDAQLAFYGLIQSGSRTVEADLNALADQTDKFLSALRVELSKYAFVASTEVFLELEAFCEFMEKGDLEPMPDDLPMQIQRLSEHTDLAFEKANHLSMSMQKDLQLPGLHHSLLRRIASKRKE